MTSISRFRVPLAFLVALVLSFAAGLAAANKVVHNSIDKALKLSVSSDKPVFVFVDSEASMVTNAPSRFQGFVKALQGDDALFKAASAFELSEIDLWDPVSETQINTKLQLKYGNVGALLAYMPGGTKAFWKGAVNYSDTAQAPDVAKEMSTHLAAAGEAVQKWRTQRDEILTKHQAKAMNDAAFLKNAEAQCDLARHFAAAFVASKAKECFERAIKAIKAADSKDPRIEGLSIEQADVAFDSEDFVLAQSLYQAFTKAFKESEGIGAAHLRVAQCQIQQGKPADARTTLKAIVANTKLDEDTRSEAQDMLEDLDEKK